MGGDKNGRTVGKHEEGSRKRNRPKAGGGDEARRREGDAEEGMYGE